MTKFKTINTQKGPILQATDNNEVYLSSISLSDTFFADKCSNYLSQHIRADKMFKVVDFASPTPRGRNRGFYNIRTLYDFAKASNKDSFSELSSFIEEEFSDSLYSEPEYSLITVNGQEYEVPNLHPTEIDDPLLKDLRWMTLLIEKDQEIQKLRHASSVAIDELKMRIDTLSECFATK